MKIGHSKAISICMATYNGEKFIAEQLRSILNQLGENDQLIISDDSSTDDTLQIIHNTNDSRITVLTNKTFKSPIFNLENALKHAIGDIIFLSDQDDIWMTDKVSTILTYLENADIVLHDCQIINEKSTILFDSFFEQNNTNSGLINNLLKNNYIGCCMAFNRKILDKALPFPSDIPMHDWWIGLIGEIYGNTVFCTEKLIAYRRHENNASASTGISQYSLLKKILFRIVMLKNLLKRYFLHV